MKEKYLKAFDAIVTFITDLWDAFATKDKIEPLILYKRLVEHIQFVDEKGILNSIKGFEYFFDKYEDLIVNDKLNELPDNTIIKYGDSDKVYLEISKYIKNSDPGTVSIIRKHLIVISAILNPSGKSMLSLKTPQKEIGKAKEVNFLSEIIDTAHKVCEEETDIKNMDPKSIDIMGIASKIISNGAFQQMFSNLGEKIAKNEVNVCTLMSESPNILSNMLSNMTIDTNNSTTTIEEVTDMEKVD